MSVHLMADAQASVHKRTRACLECGRDFPVNACHPEEHRFCSPVCRARGYRQRALPLDPPVAPVPSVQDQRVPRSEQKRLRRMSRLILERVQRGPAMASELHAMFPGARSVRTRISEAGRHVGAAWQSAPVKGIVGEWVYWIEGLEATR
jgi:hypothetical protein